MNWPALPFSFEGIQIAVNMMTTGMLLPHAIRAWKASHHRHAFTVGELITLMCFCVSAGLLVGYTFSWLLTPGVRR